MDLNLQEVPGKTSRTASISDFSVLSLPSQNDPSTSVESPSLLFSEADTFSVRTHPDTSDAKSGARIKTKISDDNGRFTKLVSEKGNLHSGGDTGNKAAYGKQEKSRGKQEGKINQGKGNEKAETIMETEAETKYPGWHEELVLMCREIEKSGDECTILYLNKSAGKHFLHSIGTTKGKQFLDGNKSIAEQFLGHCFGLKVQKYLSQPQNCDKNITKEAEKRRYDDSCSKRKQKYSSQKRRKFEATQEMDVRTQEMDVRTQEMDVRTQEMDLRAQEMDLRAQKMDLRAQEVDSRTEEMDLRTQEMDLRMHEVDLKTHEVDLRTQETDVKNNDHEYIGALQIDSKFLIKHKRAPATGQKEMTAKLLMPESTNHSSQGSQSESSITELNAEVPNSQDLSNKSLEDLISEKETIFKCYTCITFFVNEEALRVHMVQTKHRGSEWKERTYVPIKCRKENSKRKSWFRCTWCSAEFLTEMNAKWHVEKADCVPKFNRSCQVCLERFTDNNSYQLHVSLTGHYKSFSHETVGDVGDKEVPVKTKTNYKCYNCNNYYEDCNSLRRHMQATKHSGDPERDGKREIEAFLRHGCEERYRCSLCRLSFTSKILCAAHVNKTSCFNKYDRTCPICHKRMYDGFNMYSVHMKESHNQDLLPGNKNEMMEEHEEDDQDTTMDNNVCNVCGKCYKSRWLLKFHTKYYEKAENPMDAECKICRIFLDTLIDKILHLRDVHRDMRPFFCNICSTEKDKLRDLKLHYASHFSDVKAYKCDECGFKLLTPTQLKRHKARHAINRGSVEEASKLCKTFMCNDCGRVFVGKNNYDGHRLSHYQVEFQCALCENRLKRRRSLMHHYKTIHSLSDTEVSHYLRGIPSEEELAESRSQFKEDAPLDIVKVEVLTDTEEYE